MFGWTRRDVYVLMVVVVGIFIFGGGRESCGWLALPLCQRHSAWDSNPLQGFGKSELPEILETRAIHARSNRSKWLIITSALVLIDQHPGFMGESAEMKKRWPETV